MRPVAGITGDIALQHVARLKGRHAADLRQGRRRDEEVLGQALHGAQQVLGQDHPAEPPAGHREILREAVDDDGVLSELQRGVGRALVGDAVIDLVRDQAQAAVGAVVGQGTQFLAPQHRSGRIGGAGDDQAVEPAIESVEKLGGRLEAVLRLGWNQDRLHTQRGQDVAVGRVAGRGQRDPVAGLESRQKGQQETARGACGRDDACRVHLDPVGLLVVPGDAFAQGRDAQRQGVTDTVAVQGPAHGLQHRWGRRGARLTHLHVQHFPAGGLAFIGRPHDVHHDEGRDAAPRSDLERHAATPPAAPGPSREDRSPPGNPRDFCADPADSAAH